MKFERHKIGELCINVTDGEHGTIINDDKGDYYLLSNKNIKNGIVVYNEKDRRINKDSFEKINKRTKLEFDDVIIATVGTIGRTAIIKDIGLKYDFQRSVGIYKVDKSVLLPEFLHYYFQLPYVQKRLINLSTGAVQKCLFIGDLKNIDIDIPIDFNYQKQIAKVLSDLDAKIEVNNKINQELESMAKTLYDYWFVQFDFPDAKGKPYKASGGKMVFNADLKREIPEGWEVKELQNISKCIMGQSPKGESYNKDEIGIPLLNGPADYENGALKGRTYTTSPTRLCAKNDMVLCIRATIGNLVYSEQEFCLGRGVAAVRPNEERFSELVFYLLLQEIERFKIQATGSIIRGITKDDLTESKCLIPSDNLIDTFHSQVKPIFDKIRINKIENLKLSELRDWLLPMLMNGQVRVGSPVEERDVAHSYADGDLGAVEVLKQVQDDKLGMVAEEDANYDT
ncbi:restriction endonuclease subunit S [uncultured Formosa sp.]|uniref:restriction endonuclease subunit S n=1 Tax=uncultured Formosa sp. TaxID=255435 RepID=UPI00261C84A1|nr:restriction endonuclease subunit S [uncultured Formosa sp.]